MLNAVESMNTSFKHSNQQAHRNISEQQVVALANLVVVRIGNTENFTAFREDNFKIMLNSTTFVWFGVCSIQFRLLLFTNQKHNSNSFQFMKYQNSRFQAKQKRNQLQLWWSIEYLQMSINIPKLINQLSTLSIFGKVFFIVIFLCLVSNAVMSALTAYK